MLPAGVAEFLQLQTFRVGFPVLRLAVIPVLAIGALQRDDLSHLLCPSWASGLQLCIKSPESELN